MWETLKESSTKALLDQLSVAIPGGGSVMMGGDVLKDAMGKPVTSTATATSSSGGMFDSSGWNVNFGDGGITSSATKSQPVSDAANWLLIGGALIALALVVRAFKG